MLCAVCASEKGRRARAWVWERMWRFEDNLQTSVLSLPCGAGALIPWAVSLAPAFLLCRNGIQGPIWCWVVLSLYLHCVRTSQFFLVTMTLVRRLTCYFIAKGSANPFYQGPDKCSGLLGHVASAAHLPCPSRKSALDKTWMNDRLCPSVASFMKRGGGSGLVLSLWFSCLCWKSFSHLSLSGVRLLIRNASFPHICVQYSVKEVLMRS